MNDRQTTKEKSINIWAFKTASCKDSTEELYVMHCDNFLDSCRGYFGQIEAHSCNLQYKKTREPCTTEYSASASTTWFISFSAAWKSFHRFCKLTQQSTTNIPAS